MPKSIVTLYKQITNGESPDTGKLSPEFITDCFKYKLLKEKPSKKHIKWFEDVFEQKYPELNSDISKSLKKEMNRIIKQKKHDEEIEEKWKKQRAKRGYSDSDCWNIYSWFLNVMPKMLQQMRDNLHGFPSEISAIMPDNQAVSNTALNNDAEEEPGFTRWKETLDRMIFLLHEMDEDACSYKNPYEEEYTKMNQDFHKKYGYLGEGLKSEEEKEEEKKKHSSRIYFPSDFPELYPEAKDLSHFYYLHEMYKKMYIDKCREEFFSLFSKNFYNLWD